MLLLRCNLKKIWAETGRILVIFLIGSAGTVLGAYLAFFLLKGPYGNAGDLARVAAMMTGTNTGGSVNLAAMASQYAAGDDVTAASIVADNLTMALYFFALIFFAGSAQKKQASSPGKARLSCESRKCLRLFRLQGEDLRADIYVLLHFLRDLVDDNGLLGEELMDGRRQLRILCFQKAVCEKDLPGRIADQGHRLAASDQPYPDCAGEADAVDRSRVQCGKKLS